MLEDDVNNEINEKIVGKDLLLAIGAYESSSDSGEFVEEDRGYSMTSDFALKTGREKYIVFKRALNKLRERDNLPLFNDSEIVEKLNDANYSLLLLPVINIIYSTELDKRERVNVSEKEKQECPLMSDGCYDLGQSLAMLSLSLTYQTVFSPEDSDKE